jgi:hypothetical protein
MVGFDVDGVDLAFRVAVTAFADVHESHDLAVELSNEGVAEPSQFGAPLRGHTGEPLGGKDMRVGDLPRAHGHACGARDVVGCSGPDQASNLHLR